MSSLVRELADSIQVELKVGVVFDIDVGGGSGVGEHLFLKGHVDTHCWIFEIAGFFISCWEPPAADIFIGSTRSSTSSLTSIAVSIPSSDLPTPLTEPEKGTQPAETRIWMMFSTGMNPYGPHG